MLRNVAVFALTIGVGSSPILADELPKGVLGIWHNPGSEYEKCTGEILEIELTKRKAEYVVSGRSGDWVGSWTNAKNIAAEKKKSKITGGTAEMIVYSVKTQCEKIDEGKDNPGIALIVYEPPGNPTEPEQLFIHSAADAYSGNYRRCKK